MQSTNGTSSPPLNEVIVDQCLQSDLCARDSLDIGVVDSLPPFFEILGMLPSQEVAVRWKRMPRYALVLGKPQEPAIEPAIQMIVRVLEELNIKTLELKDPGLSEGLSPSPIQLVSRLTQRHLGVTLADIDMLVCCGGDGTFLHAANLFGDRVPPIVAFRGGSMGFLTPFPMENVEDTFRALFTHSQLRIMLRPRLQCTIVDPNGKVVFSRCVLNEAATFGHGGGMGALQLCVDGQRATKVYGDGIIVATSTGSTAYSASAGGPMVHPSLGAMVITPVCPHSLSFRPLVLPDTCRVSVAPESRVGVSLSFDGRAQQTIHRGYTLICTRALHAVPSLAYPPISRPSFGSAAGLSRRTQPFLRRRPLPTGSRPLIGASSSTGLRAVAYGRLSAFFPCFASPLSNCALLLAADTCARSRPPQKILQPGIAPAGAAVVPSAGAPAAVGSPHATAEAIVSPIPAPPGSGVAGARVPSPAPFVPSPSPPPPTPPPLLPVALPSPHPAPATSGRSPSPLAASLCQCVCPPPVVLDLVPPPAPHSVALHEAAPPPPVPLVRPSGSLSSSAPRATSPAPTHRPSPPPGSPPRRLTSHSPPALSATDAKGDDGPLPVLALTLAAPQSLSPQPITLQSDSSGVSDAATATVEWQQAGPPAVGLSPRVSPSRAASVSIGTTSNTIPPGPDTAPPPSPSPPLSVRALARIPEPEPLFETPSFESGYFQMVPERRLVPHEVATPVTVPLIQTQVASTSAAVTAVATAASHEARVQAQMDNWLQGLTQATQRHYDKWDEGGC